MNKQWLYNKSMHNQHAQYVCMLADIKFIGIKKYIQL